MCWPPTHRVYNITSSSLLHRKYLTLLCCLFKVSQYQLVLIDTASVHIVKGISPHIHNIVSDRRWYIKYILSKGTRMEQGGERGACRSVQGGEDNTSTPWHYPPTSNSQSHDPPLFPSTDKPRNIPWSQRSLRAIFLGYNVNRNPPCASTCWKPHCSMRQGITNMLHVQRPIIWRWTRFMRYLWTVKVLHQRLKSSDARNFRVSAAKLPSALCVDACPTCAHDAPKEVPSDTRIALFTVVYSLLNVPKHNTQTK